MRTEVERLIEVPADSRAAEEVDRQRDGQGLGIQPTGHALGFDCCLEYQRQMVESWMCSAVGDMKTYSLVREGTWQRGGEAHAPREGPLAPGMLRRASPVEA